MSILTLGSKKEKKENFQSKRKQKRKERKFPIKEWEKAKRKERKFPIKEWEKVKKKEGEEEVEGKKAPDQGSKEKKEEICRKVFGPDNI